MASPRRKKQVKVLVIEDDAHTQAFLCDLLTHEGYRVEATGTGSGAVEMAREGKPDLITLDLGLPGKSGFQVLEELRSDAATRDIPVFVLSAYSDLLERWGRTQPDRSFTKPLDVQDYLSSLRQVVHSGNP